MILQLTMGSNSILPILLIAVLLLHQDFVDAMAMVHHKPTSSGTAADTHKSTSISINQPSTLLHDRRNVFTSFLSSTIAVATISSLSASSVLISSPKVANAIPEQKSYSSNARNMERLSSGDSSGGSSYNNSPESPVAAKRRAMVGCKVSSSRIEASRLESAVNDGGAKVDIMNEKECNMRVMGGDSEFMLKALRNLDCPTCPYGIEGA